MHIILMRDTRIYNLYTHLDNSTPVIQLINVIPTKCTLVQLLDMKPHISLTDHARKYLGMTCFEDKADKENN